MKRAILIAVSLSSFFILSACGTSSKAQASDPTDQAQQAQTNQQEQASEQGQMQANQGQMMQQTCPMQLEGTSAKIEKLDDAVALDFTTTGDVDQLRQRVRQMAQMHQQNMGRGQMMHGQQGQMMQGQQGQMHGQQGQMHGQMNPQMRQMMANSTVEAEEIDNGMRLKFVPNDASQVDQMYQMIQQRRQMMSQRQGCPMMMQMVGGGPVEQQQEQNTDTDEQE